MADLNDILSIKKQVGIVQRVMGGLITDNMPSALLSTFNNDFEGNSGTYMEVDGTKQVARFAEYGAKGHTQNGKQIREVPVTLASAAEEKAMDPMAITLLKSGVQANIERVELKIQNEREDFLERFINLRKASVQSVLATGTLSYDSDYNLLPSSAGASNSIDFGVPAGNKGDISGIISASWATASTDIPKQVLEIITKSRQDAGFPVTTALYGKNILKYLATNDSVANQWAGASASFNDSILTNAIPSGLLGIRDWMYFGDAFYEDASGTNQSWIGDDDIIFLPDVSKAWWEIGQGTTPVASSYEPKQSEQEAIDSINLIRGAYGYAYINRGDMAIKFAQGDCFLPILKNANVVFQADVTP